MVYRPVRGLIRFLFWLFVDLDVQGKERLPSEGAALLACNHVNLMDPVVPIGALERRVSFMAKEELFSVPLFGRLLRALEVVPVARGKIAARRALARAEELLRRGWLFCIYPEGTRSHQPGMGPAHNGAALLALRTGVPVFPCAITGTHMVMQEGKLFPRRGPVSLHIGSPLSVERTSGKIGREMLDGLTDRIMRHIAALLPPEYRGHYGMEPGVAGAGP